MKRLFKKINLTSIFLSENDVLHETELAYNIPAFPIGW